MDAATLALKGKLPAGRCLIIIGTEGGTFSDTHEAFVTSLLQGHAAIEAKLESAVRGGAGAAATKKEIERDLNAFVEDFGHLEERLHAESMKH